MSPQETSEAVGRLKREFRSMMNGVVSASMRAKGVGYGVNFGVEGVRLTALARETPHDSALARALWQENVRECRLLATMVQPPAELSPEACGEWLATLRTAEEAQYLSTRLLCLLPYAGGEVLAWMASADWRVQLCGFLTAGRLLADGVRFYARERNELLDHCEAALQGGTGAVAKAACNALSRFAAQNQWQEREVEKIFSKFAGENPE